jgi:hypothetical protein
MGFIS